MLEKMSNILINLISKNSYRLIMQAPTFLFIIINRNSGEHLKTYKTLLQAFTVHPRVPDWVEWTCHVLLPLLYKGTVCFSQVEVGEYCMSPVKIQAHK